jgi:Domain of unknown function (DUF4281)
MTPDALFHICGTLAMLGWLCLLSTPMWPVRYRETLPRRIGAIAIPASIAAVYTGVIVTHWAGHPGGFNSLDAVMQLFTDRWLVVAGWVHYLAFDLFIGGWELAESRQRRIPHLLLIPFLLLTFFFGPIGFLAFLAVRSFFYKIAVTARA